VVVIYLGWIVRGLVWKTQSGTSRHITSAGSTLASLGGRAYSAPATTSVKRRVSLFPRARKKRAIHKVLTLLPGELTNRYGKRGFYTNGQVQTVLREVKLSKACASLAVVLFLAEDDAIAALNSEESYRAIVEEIADLYFDGDRNFVSVPLTRRKVGNQGHSSIGANIEAFHD